MSFSLQHKRYKTVFTSFIVISLFLTIRTESDVNLVNLPLQVPSQSVNLRATLTDTSLGNKYFIQEYISASSSNIKGKIEISSEKDSYTIHYNTASNIKNERLVIHGKQCLPFIFKNNWDNTLPGINKPVTNLILLMGPSILYRLAHSSLVWKEALDRDVRGTMMYGATTQINKRLSITYYYKKHYKDDSGLRYPSRILFVGYDPYSSGISSRESLVLDIYLQNEIGYDQFVNEVQPLPGIGCSHYLNFESPLIPKLRVDYLHYTIHETIQGPTTTRTVIEIHTSAKTKLLRIRAVLFGKTTEAVYDYQLGIVYLIENNGYCKIYSADLSSPGVSSAGYFNLFSLFLMDEVDASYKYLGKVNFEHRSGFPVHAWEKISFKVNINGKKVDKAVVTQYFAESRISEIFYGHTLVSTTITCYKLDSSKKTYSLEDTITRDYINFESAGSEDELHDIFTIKDCKYLSSDKQLALGFKLQSQGDYSTDKLTESHIYQLKKNFMYDTILSKNISPLRIDTVDYNFDDAQIEIEVTFLDIFNLQSIFDSEILTITADTFQKAIRIPANNELECLERLSEYSDTIIVAIFRPRDSFCGYLRNYDDLKEDKKAGDSCSIYHFPLNNLRRIKREIPLDKIHSTYLQDVGKSFFLVATSSYLQIKPFKLVDVVDKTKNQITPGLMYKSKKNAKLAKNDQVMEDVPDMKNLADCYRACHDSEQLACNAFSFCENGDTIECRVTSLPINEVYKNVTHETAKNCTIFSLKVLYDYTEVPQRRFKTPTSIPTEHDVDACAQYCHASPDCFSFQFCDNYCSFGGFYTDSATEYDNECSLYIPKVTSKYQKTGNKIVSDVIYSEMNLNLDQCASLCHGWSDGDSGCKSFNYCPKSKTESSCSLAKFSVKSSDVITNDGGKCSNYEMKEESKGKSKSQSNSIESVEGTTGSAAFGIIMLFLFVGALFGFAAPIVLAKVKQLQNTSKVNANFSWSRQVDEPTGNID